LFQKQNLKKLKKIKNQIKKEKTNIKLLRQLKGWQQLTKDKGNSASS